MRKRLLTLALSLATFVTLQAQTIVSNPDASAPSQVEDTSVEYKKAKDWYGGYCKELETVNIGFGCNQGKRGYFEIGGEIGIGDIDCTAIKVGYGLVGRSCGESSLLQVKAFPYVTYCDIESKSEFSWGVQVRAEAGLKLCETKKKNNVYLNVGYGISAPELETSDMFKNGVFYLSITYGI